jgi:hypothetical protein
MVEDSEVFWRYLRRYVGDHPGGWTCEEGWHQAKAPIEDIPATWQVKEGRRYMADVSGDLWPHDDPRWPKTCEKCSFEFRDTDPWQLFHDNPYRLPDGSLKTLIDLPPGAMWWARWYSPPHLYVMLPPGRYDYWDIDGPSSSGGHWTRAGEPPNVTVSPSIMTPRYHSFLTGGVLGDG